MRGKTPKILLTLSKINLWISHNKYRAEDCFVCYNIGEVNNILKKLVIKPTFDCFCNCSFCSERQNFYRKNKAEHSEGLDIDLVLKIMDEADGMGVNNLQISGGDPLLYKDLDKIIERAYKYHWFNFINSTGYNLDYKKAYSLMKIGLSAFNTSIDSSQALVHDQLRNKKSTFVNTLNAIDCFNLAKRDLARGDFFINIQTILNRYNFKSLDLIFEMALKKDISSIYLMYPYSDFNNVISPTLDELKYFQKNTVKKILSVINKYKDNKEIYNNSKKILMNLFPRDNAEVKLYKKRRYFNSIDESKKYCLKPLNTLMIIANGDVIPCCTLENRYTNIVGNIYKQSLIDIWNGDRLFEFRKNRNQFCTYCPSSINRTIGLIPEMLKQF